MLDRVERWGFFVLFWFWWVFFFGFLCFSFIFDGFQFFYDHNNLLIFFSSHFKYYCHNNKKN